MQKCRTSQKDSVVRGGGQGLKGSERKTEGNVVSTPPHGGGPRERLAGSLLCSSRLFEISVGYRRFITKPIRPA